MKKLILLAISIAMSCSVCVADTGNVKMYNDDNGIKGKNNSSETPVVNYEDNEVTITSTHLIEEAYIIIRDAEGKIVTKKIEVLSPVKITINVPKNIVENGYTIEIYYGNTYLYGFLK